MDILLERSRALVDGFKRVILYLHNGKKLMRPQAYETASIQLKIHVL
jgi:hypothetical protein